MPRYIIGAVSMKIRSRTSTTSTSGMMLISAIAPPMRRGSLPPLSGLNAIFRASRHLGRGAAHLVQQLEGEALHLCRPVLDAVHEEVVADDRGDRRAEAGRGGD